MSLAGEHKLKNGQVRSVAAAPELPMSMKGNRSTTMYDAGMGLEYMTGVYADATSGWVVPPIEICEQIRAQREKFVRLKRSLLVRVRTSRKGETVELLCGCDAIGHKGLVLSLPCTLDFTAGATSDLELFLTQDREPLPIRGTVRNISRTVGEDTIRYKVEIEFGRLNSLTRSELDAFVHAAKPEEQRPLLV